MAGPYDKPHLSIHSRLVRQDYTAPRRDMSGGGTPRERVAHGERLAAELALAAQNFNAARPTREGLPEPEGVFLEVDLVRGTPVDLLERKNDGILPGATRLQENQNKSVGVYVPEGALPVLQQILDEYAHGALTERGNPRRQSLVEPIEAIREATFRTFWTDSEARLPTTSNELIWWEIWCLRSAEDDLLNLARQIDLRVAESDRRLYFPETVVVPVYGSKTAIELLLFIRFSVTEIRRASDTPVFFLDQDAEGQTEWTEGLAERTIWPGRDAVAVCLLDTGVNRGHTLIEPALDEADLDSVKLEWNSFDTGGGHGTGMAGLALHGDLVPLLASGGEIPLNHRLESVKIIPPDGFPANEPSAYGAISQSAIAIPEINRPERRRVYCLAITNLDVSGEVPSSWSAALDQAAAGVMAGDADRPRRLILVATGNAPVAIDANLNGDIHNSPIEDPAQAWNALTVGGYTDKTLIDDEGYEHFTPHQAAGELSLHTRTSMLWQTKSPIKPDIVMEAGNHGLSPAGNDVLELDSLGLLTTGPDTATHQLVPFRATSAATALASRFAGRLMADHADLWPETIRALMVHSAEWTPPMMAELNAAEGLTGASALLRRYGHGVPNYDVATASSENHLALISQAEMQPFCIRNGRRFKDCHFYPLPWPREALESLGDQNVSVKITLSYFVEPNPGVSAGMEPYRYQSFGLRFDLRRRNESMRDFIVRVNAGAVEEAVGRPAQAGPNDNWRFGPNSVSAGSLHSDTWTGPAAQLLTRNAICIKPVGGWWRSRADRETCNRNTRYALVISISSENSEVDLYTPIAAMIENRVNIESIVIN
ncbi:MAG: S8 family peptidase [Hyphomonas sp.]